MKKGIQLTDVSFAYADANPVINHLTCTIHPGTFLGVTGVNGSGKSTFTYLLNGLIPHFSPGTFSGEVTIDGVRTAEKTVGFLAQRVGMVFQNPDFSLFNLTVEEEIAFGMKNLKKLVTGKKVSDILSSVGLKGFLKRDPQTLSYGQKQKVALACVIALDTDYIVLDEPSSMLDFKSSIELYRLLTLLQRKGKTIIVIEHDTDFLLTFSRESLILDNGSAYAFGNTKKILSDKKSLLKLGIKIPHFIHYD
jgi:energy-coupling factor transport system ATP-binding protein